MAELIFEALVVSANLICFPPLVGLFSSGGGSFKARCLAASYASIAFWISLFSEGAT